MHTVRDVLCNTPHRLYTEAGRRGLAERCLAAARSHDPAAAPVWEAMGALAALSPVGGLAQGPLLVLHMVQKE